jgi:hypothetical protein
MATKGHSENLQDGQSVGDLAPDLIDAILAT